MRRHGTSALVLSSSGLPAEADNRHSPQQPGQQEPITQAFSTSTDYFHCQENRSFYPDSNYEVVTMQASTRNANSHPDIFHVLNCPIDQLRAHLGARAIRLQNLRNIIFHNPLSWDELMRHFISITETALYILSNVPELRKIAVCADMLSDRIFQALADKLYLREMEILLPSVSFPFPNRLAGIGDVLNRGFSQLPQLEYVKIPIDLVTNTLLSCLGRLPRLQCLKSTGSVNAPYPARYFIACMGNLHIENPRIFGNLQLLDLRDHNLPQGDFFAKDTLTRILPSTKFIET